MIKVKVTFQDKSYDDFYALEIGKSCQEGRAVFWNLENEKVVTYVLDGIFKIDEVEV
jgi:hypothetical protein